MKHRLQAPNSGLEVEADINPEWVNGIGGATFPRLAVQVSLSIKEETGGRSTATTQAVAFGMLTGELFVGSDKLGDAKPVPVNRPGMQYRPYQDEIHQTLEFPLDARRIEWLEQQRAGKSLEGRVQINLSVLVFGFPSNPPDKSFEAHVGLKVVSYIFGEIPFTIPDTHWREKVLPALGYGKVIVIELPVIPLEACKALEHSFKALEKAQQLFGRGLYDESVAACRVAMDPFFEQVGKGDGSGKTIPRLKKSWETRLGQATYDWLNDGLVAVKIEANKPHHSPNSHFDRLGAQMLLMVTTALIAYAARYDREWVGQ